jgi:SulP family sulfate permease
VAILSLLLVAQRAARPRTTFLVRVPGTDSFRGTDATPDGVPEPGLLVYRFDAPLFFANADVLRDDVTEATTTAEPPAQWVILDLESVSDVDSTAAEMLLELAADLRARGIGLALARLKAPVADYLLRAGLFDAVGRDRVYLEVDDAVAALATITPSWLDDRGEGAS